MNEHIARTTQGNWRGTFREGVSIFRGIQYGADTGGLGRFRVAASPQPWTGVRDAVRYGPACPQSSGLGGPSWASEAFVLMSGFIPPEDEEYSENCLTLNVWTAGLRDQGKRPVMVWLHGGAWTMGSGSAMNWNGEQLARNNQVVVVTVNHRLSIFGHLFLGDWAPDSEEFASSGNVGVLDLVKALEWVRDNIDEFGGDPGNVTIFGASGGGSKTHILMALPSASGLFHRAIVQSGYSLLQTPSRAQAVEATERVLLSLDIKRGDMKKLQRVSAAQLHGSINAARYEFQPMIDGNILPKDPFELYRSGCISTVPTLIGGSVSDHLFKFPEGFGWLTDDQVRGHLRSGIPWVTYSLGERTDSVFTAYRTNHPWASASTLLGLIWTDAAWRIPAIRLAEARLRAGAAALYMYRFEMYPFMYDIQLAFDQRGQAPFSESPVRGLLSQVNPAWIEFARSGDPGHAALPAWPAYDSVNRATMMFDYDCRIEHDPSGLDREIWRDIL